MSDPSARCAPCPDCGIVHPRPVNNGRALASAFPSLKETKAVPPRETGKGE